MAKPILTTIVLTLACLFTLSFALPSAFSQITPAQTEPNVPHTLLGKPYWRRLDSQECPQSYKSPTATDRDDSDADGAAQQVLAGGNDGCIQATPDTARSHVQLPLPLILNMPPQSIPARSRWTKLKGPWQYGPCSDEESPSDQQTRSDGTAPRVEGVQRVQVVVRSGGKTKLRNTSIRVGRSNRLHNREEWKSRLFQEY